MPNVWFTRLWSVVVVTALLALAAWGHLTKWQLPSLAGETSADKDAKSKLVTRTSSDRLADIEFASADVVRQVGIDTQPAECRDIAFQVSAHATVGYDQTRLAQLAPRVSGFVWRVEAALGQFVHKGDVLALIDAPEVGQARTDFLQEFSAHHFALKRLDRLQKLAGMGAASEASLREAEITVLETRVRRFNTYQRLINLGLEIDLTEVEKLTPDDLAKRIQSLGFSKSLLKKLEPTPKTANLIPLFASADGIVTQYDLVAGKRITPERNDIEIADVRRMWIRLSVRKEDAGRLALGQSVEYAAVAGTGPPLEGRLEWIGTTVDEKTRTVQARAAVANPCLGPKSGPARGPWLLRANEYGTAQIKVGHCANAILVSAKAVQRFDDMSLVFVLSSDGKTFQPRKVELGEARNGAIQIRSGVVSGERVATSNSFVLKSELLKDRMDGP